MEVNHLEKWKYITRGLDRHRRVELEIQRVARLLLVFVRNVALRPAPSREFGGRVGRLVDGTPPGLARRVRKAPTMIVRRPLSGADRRNRPSGRVYGPSVQSTLSSEATFENPD